MKVLDAKSIIAEVKKSKATLQVVNVWASWCAPCLKELPNFAQAEKQSKEVEFFYVSGDEDKDAIKAENFIANTGVKGTKWRLQPIDENAFTTLAQGWSGSLPTTFFFAKGQLQERISKALSAKELSQKLKKHLKSKEARLPTPKLGA